MVIVLVVVNVAVPLIVGVAHLFVWPSEFDDESEEEPALLDSDDDVPDDELLLSDSDDDVVDDKLLSNSDVSPSSDNELLTNDEVSFDDCSASILSLSLPLVSVTQDTANNNIAATKNIGSLFMKFIFLLLSFVKNIN